MFKTWLNLLRGEDSVSQGRIVASNIAWLTLDKFLVVVDSVLVRALVARYLGPHLFGLFNYTLVIATLLSIPVELGLDAVVKREILKYPQNTSALLGTTFFLKIVMSSLILIGLNVFCHTALPSNTQRSLLLILGWVVWSQVFLTFDLWFQAKILSRYTVLARNIALFIASFLRLGAIFMYASILSFAWIYIGEIFLFGTLLGFFYHQLAGPFKNLRVDLSLIRSLIKESWPIIFSSVATILYMRIDQIMLGWISGDTAVGIYSAAVKMSEVFHFIPLAFSISLFPNLFKNHDVDLSITRQKWQTFYDMNIMAAYGIIFLGLLFAKKVILVLFGEAFSGSASILIVHLWSCIFIFLGLARANYIVIHVYHKFAFFSTCFGMLLNIVLNLYLIPLYEGYGAAIGTIIAYAFSTIISSFLFAPMRNQGILQIQALLFPIRLILSIFKSKT